jgi:hypothetical protein
MNLLFLSIYLVIIIAVIEIFVILFRLTGLKMEVSRFQVISLMTGTGFTTGESELILGHPIRRKLATFLILFGAFSFAVIISSISQFLSNDLRTKEILSGACTVIVVLCVLKLASIQEMLSRLFNRKMKQNVELADLPIREVFLQNKEDALLNLHIYKDSDLINHTLNQVIKEHNKLELIVLFIKRGDVKIRKNVYDTSLHEGDQILLFGTKTVIRKIFNRDINKMEEKLKNQQLPLYEMTS